MDTRLFCAYNKTSKKFLGPRLKAVDAAREPIRVLKLVMDGLSPQDANGLWVINFRGIPIARTTNPFDLVYLDEGFRVLQAIEISQHSVFEPFKGQPESALILPAHTVHKSKTFTGDQVIIANAEQTQSPAATAPTPPARSTVGPVPPRVAPVIGQRTISVGPRTNVPRGSGSLLKSASPLVPAAAAASTAVLDPEPVAPEPVREVAHAAPVASVAPVEIAPAPQLHPAPEQPSPALEPQAIISPAPEIETAPVLEDAATPAPAEPETAAIPEIVAAPEITESPEGATAQVVEDTIMPTATEPAPEQAAQAQQVVTEPIAATPFPTAEPVAEAVEVAPPAVAEPVTPAAQPVEEPIAESPTAASPIIDAAAAAALPVDEPINVPEVEEQASAPEPAPEPALVEEPPTTAPATVSTTLEETPAAAETIPETPTTLITPAIETVAATPASAPATIAAPPTFAHSFDAPDATEPEAAEQASIPFPASESHSAHQIALFDSHPVALVPAEPLPANDPLPTETPSDSSAISTASVNYALQTVPEETALQPWQQRIDPDLINRWDVRLIHSLFPELHPSYRPIFQAPRMELFKDGKEVPKNKKLPLKIRMLNRFYPGLHLDTLEQRQRESRRSPRLPKPGLVGYYFTGGISKPHEIQNISVTGFFMKTEERLLPGTVIRMTLQVEGSTGEDPNDTITVHSRVISWSPSGGGFEFVLPGFLE